MRVASSMHSDGSRPIRTLPANASGSNRLLYIFAVKDNGDPPPWVIVVSSIVVTPDQLVHVDVQEAVARDRVPAEQVRSLPAADRDVRGSLKDHASLDEAKEYRRESLTDSHIRIVLGCYSYRDRLG